MAYANSRSAQVSFSDRVMALVKSVKASVEQRRIYAQTLQELSALSDRDLTDMGISRVSIPDVAREAAYKS
jgi:uncharacterized protein YjiS (DUF1127 family)